MLAELVSIPVPGTSLDGLFFEARDGRDRGRPSSCDVAKHPGTPALVPVSADLGGTRCFAAPPLGLLAGERLEELSARSHELVGPVAPTN
jgi:hypothetical protein